MDQTALQDSGESRERFSPPKDQRPLQGTCALPGGGPAGLLAAATALTTQAPLISFARKMATGRGAAKSHKTWPRTGRRAKGLQTREAKSGRQSLPCVLKKPPELRLGRQP
ncbi:UNVERIFIED_CONTAM: hypothetical protein HHA_453970 [Hammondia hammondi]|eukprot:XP_008887367.1 hypothetical protein HHA_453970 [Hammondia hammondi]